VTTTYRTMTGEQARAAGAAPDLIDYPLTLDADRDAYESNHWGVFRLADGVPVELLGTDGGEPEDQTLARDWAWVTGALTAAYTYGSAEGTLLPVQREALAEVMQRCAQAMADDGSCSFSGRREGSTWNGDANSFEASGALQEVAELLGIPGPLDIECEPTE
jgi:hypothetical protein